MVMCAGHVVCHHLRIVEEEAMSHSSFVVKIVALLALCCFAGPAAIAFDVPNPKPKKEKKKNDTQDAAPADSKPADSQPAQDKKPAADADAPPPQTGQAGAVFELKMPKSMWEKSGIKDLKVGDWLESSSPMMGDSKSRMEVIEIGDHYTLVMTKMTMMGNTTEQKMKTVYSDPDPENKDAEKQRKELKIETKEFDDKVKVGDKEVGATRYETYQDGKLVSKSWISKEVPLGGGVRVEDGTGKLISVATGFGRGK
jgi:hypothetical protein